MAVTVYSSNIKTNIDITHNLHSYIEEINRNREYKLLVERYTVTVGRFRKKTKEYYRVYWELGYGEYQRLFALEGLNEQAVECYLVGFLGGIEDKHKRKDDMR